MRVVIFPVMAYFFFKPPVVFHYLNSPISRFLDLRVLVYRLFFSDAVYISHFHIAYLYDYFTSELSFEL